MRLNCCSSMMIAFVAVLLAAQGTDAFVKGSATTRTRPSFATTERYAVAKKKAATKKAAVKASAKAAKKDKVVVESCRKPEFIASLALKLDMNKADADLALQAVLGTIQENVVAGKKVMLPGFGSFQLRARAARKGRNPQTGAEIDIKASKSPGFTAAKAFKESANE